MPPAHSHAAHDPPTHPPTHFVAPRCVDHTDDIYQACLDEAHAPQKEERVAAATEADLSKEALDAAERGRSLRGGDAANHSPEEACAVKLADVRRCRARLRS